MKRNYEARWTLVCSLASFLVLSAASTALADSAERVLGEDFGSLDAWELPRIAVDTVREIAENNSTFTDLVPSNQRCLLLADEVGLAHTKFLRQNLPPIEGSVEFSVDFKLSPAANEQDNPGDGNSGYSGRIIVALLNGGENVHTVVLDDIFIVNLFAPTGRPGYFSLKRDQALTPGVWYSFRARLDLANRSMKWTLDSESGESWENEATDLYPDAFPDGVSIDAIGISAVAGPGNKTPPTWIDNITLRQVAAP